MLGITATLLWFSPAHSVDTIELSGGGHLAGAVRRLPERKIDIVKVDDSIMVAIPKTHVRRVVSDEKLTEYIRRASKVGQDAEKHYDLAIWCAKNIKDNRDAYLRHHMQLAIRFNSEHSKARAALDYVREKGKWVRYSDLQRSRGMISVAGKWVLPEAAAIEEVQDTTNVGSKKWIREVERLVRVVLRGNSKSDEAMDTLRAIKDPLASTAIAKQLLNSKQPRALRLLWIELLARFRDIVSYQALVQVGVNENDDVIREKALDELAQHGAHHAVATYVNMLRSKNNRDVLKAARALTYFPDPGLALEYVNALVTTHQKTIMPAGGGTNAGFTGNGSSGFSTGQKPKVITRHLENPPALTLLKMIEPEVDFGYDERAWREYFARKHGSYSGDLRRD